MPKIILFLFIPHVLWASSTCLQVFTRSPINFSSQTAYKSTAEFRGLAQRLFGEDVLRTTEVVTLSSKDLAKLSSDNELLKFLATDAGAFTLDPRLSQPEHKARDQKTLALLKEALDLAASTKAVVVLFSDKVTNDAFVIHELTHVKQGERGEVFEATNNISEYVTSKQEVEAMLTTIIAFRVFRPRATFEDFWLFHKEMNIHGGVPDSLRTNRSFLAHKFLFNMIIDQQGQVRLKLKNWTSDPLGVSLDLESWLKAQDIVLSQIKIIRSYIQESF